MTTLYKSLALILAIVFVSTGKADIYTWLDDEGKVNYGDCPPITCESDEIQNAPAPSDQAIKEAQERFKRLQEYQEMIRESYKEEVEKSDKSIVNYQTDAKCFTSPEDAWEGRIPDNREGLQRKTLNNAEHRRLRTLINSLDGHWHGKIEDTTCVRQDATPPIK